MPVLEDDVELGAYAQVLGGVRVGRGAKIGAMSVVLQRRAAGRDGGRRAGPGDRCERSTLTGTFS